MRIFRNVKKSIKHISIAICLSTFMLPMFAQYGTHEADKKKAQYIFLEAIAKNTENDASASFDLLQAAHSLDPENPTIGFYYGMSILSADEVEKEEMDTALSLMKRNTLLRPDDFYENYIYAILCSSISDYDETIRVVETLLKKYPDRIQMYPVLAKSYASKNEFGKAVAVIDSLEKTEGRSTSTTIMKIGYLLNMNDTTAIIATGKQYLSDAPKSVEPNTLMGNVYAQLSMPDSAFVYYDKALAIDPDYGYANLQKANLYYSTGDSTNYEKEITSVLLNKNIEVGTKVDILTDYIRTHIQQNDSSDRVDNMFATILEQHSHEAQIHRLYCDYLTYRGKYDAAAEQLSYTVDIDPSDPKDWERLMWLYTFSEKPEKAIETGSKALSYDPEHITYYQIIGAAYYNMGDYDKSIEYYDTLLEKNKTLMLVNEADIYSALAESYNQKGDIAATLRNYEISLEIEPDNPLTLNNYAYSLCISYSENADSLAKAEKMSKRSIDIEPENSSSLDTYAWIMFLKRDYKTALEYIEKAMENADSERNNAELLEHYGDILFMLGRPDEALEQWKKALEENPDSELLKKKVDHKTYFYE